MAKNVIYSVFYIAEYVTFMLATIAVIVFQFTANEFLVISALILYVIAFGIMTTNECLGVDALKKQLAKEDLKEADARLNSSQEIVSEGLEIKINENDKTQNIDDNEKEKLEKMTAIKKQINWGYAKIILCGVFCIFSFVVLILF